MKIGNYKIGRKKVFVIAEIGNNHNGSFDLAKEMVDAAIEAGADCVKFQMRNMASVYRKKSLAKKGEDLGTEYILDLLKCPCSQKTPTGYHKYQVVPNDHRHSL